MNETSNPITVNGQTLEPGCYVDGHWGQYGASRVLHIADDLLGTSFYAETAARPDTETGSHISDELCGDEAVVWASEKAETALNDATTGGYWSWSDGEFFLVSDDEESEDY